MAREVTNEELVNAIRESDRFTKGEKLYAEFQYGNGSLGHFHTSLFQTIGRADDANLAHLTQAFPEEVTAYRNWTEGFLYNRVQDFREELEDAKRNRNQGSEDTVPH